MIKTYYIIVDAEDREVNFYDSTFPEAEKNAILSAKQVEGAVILKRRIDSDSGEKRDEIIWGI